MSDPDTIAEIRERLAGIERTQMHHGDTIKDGFAKLDKKLDAFDARISNVEGRVAGVGAITGAIASLGMSLIVGKFTGKIG